VGVDVRSRRAGTEGPAATIAAHLVVDASGRRSPAPAWLAAAGAEVPGETVIDAGLVHASRVLRRCPRDTPGWTAALLQGRPPASPRAGVLVPLERDRWLLTLAGAGAGAPRTDERGFAADARSLGSPEVTDLLDGAEPLGPATGPWHAPNQRRHYERMVRPLDGFVAVGDALCALNPVHAQGMGVAARGAEALDRCLAAHVAADRDLAGVSARAQRAVARAVDGPWTLATGADLRWPGATGDRRGRLRRAAGGAFGRYADRVAAAACADPAVLVALVDVVGLLRPPGALLRPEVALRALARRPGRSTGRRGRDGDRGAEADTEAAMAPG
jgi:2-polyprenyl-6-methoxyphenol hydroxylase-like FAD-dependent oxidoreductase